MTEDLTKGNELKAMVRFSIPLMIGNLLQQLYNVVDTLIVGKALGGVALAAVGASFSLMTFITAISLGFCMGSGVVFSHLYGAKKTDELRKSIFNAFVLIGLLTLVLNIAAYLLLDILLVVLNIPLEALPQTKSYLQIVFGGIIFSFVYHFFAGALRSVGNSKAPLLFLAAAAITNVVLDILFVVPFGWGVEGAALATVIAQGLSAVLAVVYFIKKTPWLKPKKEDMKMDKAYIKNIASNSLLTSLQQSVMNLGILMVQGLVNSHGVIVAAAFAAAVKIDAFAYMPLQDFGNGFSTYVAQNYGAKKKKRIDKGIKYALLVAGAFAVVISLGVFFGAPWLMQIFISGTEKEIIAVGVTYLQVEGSFYLLIGLLFLLYGYYRGVGKPGISLLLTGISLGLRVVLAYWLSAITQIGLIGIWIAIPIGWLVADIVGVVYYGLSKNLAKNGCHQRKGEA